MQNQKKNFNNEKFKIILITEKPEYIQNNN